MSRKKSRFRYLNPFLLLHIFSGKAGMSAIFRINYLSGDTSQPTIRLIEYEL